MPLTTTPTTKRTRASVGSLKWFNLKDTVPARGQLVVLRRSCMEDDFIRLEKPQCPWGGSPEAGVHETDASVRAASWTASYAWVVYSYPEARWAYLPK